MTNTIPNVPRELLERAWRALANSATGREIGAYLDADPCSPECAETCARASMCATCSAYLSAPSPAGVDGCQHSHSAAPRQPEGETFIGEPLIAKFVVVSRESLQALFRAAGCSGAVENSEVVNAGVRAIDGLRGEVDQLQSMLATVSKAGLRVRTERDQQAQRIGELEGLLLRVQVSLSLDDTEWGYSGAEKYKLLADIRAALSAGKEGE